MIEFKNTTIYITTEELILIQEALKTLKEKFKGKFSNETFQIIKALEIDIKDLLKKREVLYNDI